MAQAPVTLPSMMHFQDSIKRESEDSMSPYHMTYQSLPAIYDNSPLVRQPPALAPYLPRPNRY